mmetsp:Transcript_8151/g.14679  ORF Transcript_8151/g.14679 Transcript_8151/m.14679 type:complete len:213 (+) Transcript_8151:558-1196(+)
MECSHELRQLSDLHCLGDTKTCGSANRNNAQHLHKCLRWDVSAGGNQPQRGSHAECDTRDAQLVAQPGGGLARQPTDGAQAGEPRGEVCHFCHGGKGGGAATGGHSCDCVGTQQTGRHGHISARGIHISLALEHPKHTVRHHKASKDVDARESDGKSCQPARDGMGHQATVHEQQPAHGRHSTDGVGDRHQGRVERMGDAPHQIVPHQTRQS